jgi:hypothetical protein
MTRLAKPQGLIRYDSAVGLAGGKTKRIRGRVLAYAALLAVVTIGSIVSIATRAPVQAAFVRAKDAPYQQIQTAAGAPEIVNRFKVDLNNQSFEDLALAFAPAPAQAAAGLAIVTAQVPLEIKAGAKTSVELFFKFPKHLLTNGHFKATVNAYRHEDSARTPLVSEEITLVGPF